MAWDPADLRLPGWLLRLLDALVRLRMRLPNGWRFGLTRPGIVFTAAWLGVWGAAFWSGNNLLYVCGGLLSGIAFAAILRGASLLRRTARTAPPAAPVAWPMASAGEALHVALDIPVPDDGRETGEIELGWRWRGMDGDSAGEGRARLRVTGSRCRLLARWSPPRRGVFRMQDARLATAAPAGLFVLERKLPRQDAHGDWIVLPRSVAWTMQMTGRGAGEAARTEGDAWRDLRAYAAGDAPRRIHWRKAGDAPEDWLVKRFAREEGGANVLCLDLRRPAGCDASSFAAGFERMLGRARFWLEHAQEAERMTLGRQIFDLRDTAGRMAALRALAMAAPEDTPPAPCDGLWLRVDTP
ncbi:MAG: DUF58 domain-containing protein [Mariprofundaceae bacterium]